MANEKRVISLDVAMEATHKEIWWTESQQAAVRSFLVKLPRADAVEVVHGRWECEHETWGQLQCSNCKKEALLEKSNGDVGTILLYVTSNYCPNCGAKMDGDGNG